MANTSGSWCSGQCTYLYCPYIVYDTSERSTVAAARAGWNISSWFGESSGSRRNCHGAGSKPNRGFKLPLDVGGAPLEQTGAAGVNHCLFFSILSELSHKIVFSDQKVNYILPLTSEKWPPLFLLTSLGGEGRGSKVLAHQHQGRSSSFWVPCFQVMFQ